MSGEPDIPNREGLQGQANSLTSGSENLPSPRNLNLPEHDAANFLPKVESPLTESVGASRENENTRIERIAELCHELGGINERDQPRNSASLQPVTTEPVKAFRQAPLKVVRNWFRYPTYEAVMAITLGSGLSLPFYVITDIMGAPKIGGWACTAAAVITGYEIITHRRHNRAVSNFFDVTKVRPGKEKLLKDGTRVTLDDFVGEFHIGGLTRSWRLAFMRDKVKRGLIIAEGILQGLIRIGEKIKGDDPWYRECAAFKGTSWIANPHLAGRFGMEVGKDEGGRFFSGVLRKIDKKVALVPQMKAAPPGQIRTVWISREKFLEVYNSGVLHDELAKTRLALANRAAKKNKKVKRPSL